MPFQRLALRNNRKNNNNKRRLQQIIEQDDEVPKQITVTGISSMRVSSLGDSLNGKGLAAAAAAAAAATASNEEERSVRFGTVCIRDYERIAGDNPSVTRGVPIG